jgi:hypothetical protein
MSKDIVTLDLGMPEMVNIMLCSLSVPGTMDKGAVMNANA